MKLRKTDTVKGLTKKEHKKMTRKIPEKEFKKRLEQAKEVNKLFEKISPEEAMNILRTEGYHKTVVSIAKQAYDGITEKILKLPEDIRFQIMGRVVLSIFYSFFHTTFLSGEERMNRDKDWFEKHQYKRWQEEQKKNDNQTKP
jgi:hypothetical protein